VLVELAVVVLGTGVGVAVVNVVDRFPLVLPPVVLLLLRSNVPPTTPPVGKVEFEAFLASAMKASSVFPVVGALMEPTMPDWQWRPVVCEQ
jgi:hypothetical protein